MDLTSFKNTISILKIILVSVFLFISCSHTVKNELVSYADPLRNQHQNYLKTDSHGILTASDFKNHPTDRNTIAFEKLDREFPVWVCTSADNINFVCDSDGYSNQNTTNDDNFNTSFSFEQEGIFYEFLTRRGFPLSSCREQVKIWKSLAKNQKFLCAAGEPLSENRSANGQSKRTLVYHSIKSKDKCLSWFEGSCLANDH